MSDQIDIVGKQITDEVQGVWDRVHQAYPLAELGSKIPDYRQFGFPLSKFIQSHLSDRLKLIYHPRKALFVAAVPADAALPTDLEELFPASASAASARQKFSNISTARPRFRSSFWLAFARHLRPESKRWIQLQKSESGEASGYTIIEVSGGEETPPNSIEIPAELTASLQFVPVAEHIQSVHENIQKWLTEYRMSESLFIETRTGSDSDGHEFATRPTLSATAKNPIAQISYSGTGGALVELQRLAAALNIIERSDQSRIMIPLDILSKMLDRIK